MKLSNQFPKLVERKNAARDWFNTHKWTVWISAGLMVTALGVAALLHAQQASPNTAVVARFANGSEAAWASATYSGLKPALDDIVKRENETRSKVNGLTQKTDALNGRVQALENRPQPDPKKFEDALKALDKKLEEKVPLSMLKVLEGKFASLEGEVAILNANFPTRSAA